MGVTIRLTRKQIEPLTAVNPMLFQRTHPETGTFVLYSLLETPEANGSTGDETCYSCQLNLSWPVCGRDDEIPAMGSERAAKLKKLGQPLVEPYRTAFMLIPDDANVTTTRLPLSVSHRIVRGSVSRWGIPIVMP
ncbi:hypothetical protein B0T10DRAFT_463695 [Thelonectria olida]|uniref:Uncharacterized protein n=1 Tax=Thelonectria olida TaxID=1576542 RepID=A0A9P8VW66_9HYPO|nr:hypothetical protein B0T10DRAFT_463695 [Thelonectria olida]